MPRRSPRATLSIAAAAAVLALCFAAAAPAQQQTSPPPQQQQQQPGEAPAQPPPVIRDKTVIRTYDVADLIRKTRDYPLDEAMLPSTRLGGGEGGGPRGGGGGGGVFGEAAASPRGGSGATAEEEFEVLPNTIDYEVVHNLLMRSVEPDSWVDAGGSTGTISLFGSALVIRQTEAAHGQIEEMLTQLRRVEGPTSMVSVEARWLLFDDAGLHEIATASRDANHSRVVSDDVIARAVSYGRAQTLGFSGQTVHVSSGRAHNVITALHPVVGTGVAAYQAETTVLHSGVALEVTPQLVPGLSEVILDLRSVVGEVDAPAAGPATQPAPATRPALGSELAALDRVNMVAQQLRTTVRLPLNKKILIGGMTMEAAAKVGGARQLFLVIEANAMGPAPEAKP